MSNIPGKESRLSISRQKNYDVFSIGSIVIIVAVFTLFNFEYRTSIISGFIAAVLSYPLYMWLGDKLQTIGHRLLPRIKLNLHPFAAILIVLIVSLFSFTALGFVSMRLTSELPNSVQAASGFVRNLADNQAITNTLKSVGFNHDKVDQIASDADNLFNLGFLNAENILSLDNLGRVYNVGQQVLSVVASQVIYLILFLITWYNALIFGSRWVNIILALFPFDQEDIQNIKHNLTLGIRNVIYANLVCGTLNFLAVLAITLVFGLPNSFVLAALAFVIGFLPLTPSETGYVIPIILLFQSNPLVAIFIALVCELYILWQNYIFLPRLVLTGTGGNPLFIITSVFTGIALFGIMGFIIGPAIMIFINTLGEILLVRLNIVQKRGVNLT